jgi:hypothetical protein
MSAAQVWEQGEYSAAMAEPSRRFPAPWRAEPMPGGYVVRDDTGQALAYVYSRANDAEARQAKTLTTDEARRIARNIARLPELLGKGEQSDWTACFQGRSMSELYYRTLPTVDADDCSLISFRGNSRLNSSDAEFAAFRSLPVKKIALIAALALVLMAGGTAIVMTAQPTPAMADPNGGGGGNNCSGCWPQETTMKKILAFTALALMLAAGSAAVVALSPQPAMADGGGCNNC